MKRWRFPFAVLVIALMLMPLVVVDTPSEEMVIVNDSRPDTQFMVATDLDVSINADIDDDSWYGSSGVPDSHQTAWEFCGITNQTDDSVTISGFRWSLSIPQGATINSANVTFYETVDEGTTDGIIYRIDETNVGSLEGDSSVPPVDTANSVAYDFDNDGWPADVWGPTTNITDMLQDQVDIGGWSSGYYFGISVRMIVVDGTNSHRLEDYQAAGTNHAYLNISYTAGAGPSAPDSDLNFYSYTIQSDGDDDYWNYNESSWTHETTDTEVRCLDQPAYGDEAAQFRFQLDIPAEAIIHEAIVNVYNIGDGATLGVFVRRIDELNVGALESDSSIPSVTETGQAAYYFDNEENEWSTVDVTDLVQNQVDLSGWTSGYHIGFQFNTTGPRAQWYSFEDYQAAGTNHAYIDVTYTNATDSSWLTGWKYRKSHVIRQTSGADVNYTLPLNVSIGDGYDNNFTVYLGDNGRSDFGDVRFTSDNGTTLLSYNLSATYDEQETEYFSTVPVDWTTHYNFYPSVYYFNGRTYVVFQGDLDPNDDGLDPHIMYYDHTSGNWSGVYYIGHNVIQDDEPHDLHGSPALWVDRLGYINVIYGSHDSPFKYAKSVYPEDIRYWTLRPDPVTERASYPHIYYDDINNVVHILYRRQDLDSTNNIGYQNSTDYGVTWSAPQNIVEFTTVGDWPLMGVGEMDIGEQLIHVSFRHFESGDQDYDLYYIYLNVTNGHVYNVTGTDFGTTADETTEVIYCQVVDSGATPVWGNNVHIDSSGTPYHMYTEANDISFTYWNGSAWNTPDVVSTGFVAHDFIVHASDNITAFVNHDSDGDIQRYTWDGETWTWQEELYDSNRYLAIPMIPYNYHDDIQVVFGEYQDIGDGYHSKIFAWGQNGIVNGTIAKYARFYVEIPFDLDLTDIVIYVYYDKADETSESISITEDLTPWVTHARWGAEEVRHGFYYYVDNDESNVGAPTDIGTHSAFSNEKDGPDAAYDTLTEEDTGAVGNDYEDWFTNYGTDIDSYPDVGTESNPENAQDLGDSDYMTLQEADNGNSVDEYIYPDTAPTPVGETQVGNPPYLDDTSGDGDHITTNANNVWTGWYNFAPTSGTGSGFTVNCSIWLYQPDDDDVLWQLDWTGDSVADNSSTIVDPSGQWYFLGVQTDLDTATEINQCQIRFQHKKGGGPAQTITYDAARLGVSLIAAADYELDFEYQWTSANYSELYEEVCIYVGTGDSSENLTAFEWTGSTWATLGTIEAIGWNNFTATYITGSTYYIKVNDTDQGDESTQSDWEIDSIILHTWSTATNFELDLEIQWTSVVQYSYENEYICFYTGSVAAENLSIDFWNGTGWQFLMNLTASSWNNISINDWLTSSTFTTRYVDTNKTSDDNQDTWQVDAALIWVYPSGNDAPVNDATPACTNPDDTDNIYARYKTYIITANVSDPNGEEDIKYVDFVFVSNDRGSEYWTIQYNHETHAFTEKSDPAGYIELDTSGSEYSASGDDVDITFLIVFNWNQPDLTDVDARQYVMDLDSATDTDWYEIDYDTESRLDLSVGPTLTDGSGTADRGDIDGSITGSGTIIYYGGTENPLAAEIDLWISASEYGTQTGPWNATNLANDGTFSHTVYADDVIGLDTYTFKAVIQDAGAGGTDLMQTTQQDTYIADRLNITIEADGSDVENDVQVNFTLTVEFDYDDTTSTTYTIQIARNLTAWFEFTNSNKTLFNDTNSDSIYNYTAIADSTDSTHGLTEFITNLVTVTWSSVLFEQKFLFDSFIVSDTNNNNYSLVREYYDSFTIIFDTNTAADFSRVYYEGLVVADGPISLAAAFLQLMFEVFAVGGTILFSIAKRFEEAFGVNESIALAASFSRVYYEAFTIDFSYTAQQSIQKYLFESFTVGVWYALQKDMVKPLFENFTVSVWYSLEKDMVKTFSEGIIFNESIEAEKSIQKFLFESVTVGVWYALQKDVARNLSEGIVFGVDYSTTADLSRTYYESFIINETCYPEKNPTGVDEEKYLFETVAFVEVVRNAAGFVNNMNENFTVSEAIATAFSAVQNMNEGFTISDSYNTTFGAARAFSESLVIAVDHNNAVNFSRLLSEGLTLNESVDAEKFIQLLLFESVTVGVWYALQKDVMKPLFESVTFAFTCTTDKEGAWQKILFESVTSGDWVRPTTEEPPTTGTGILYELFLSQEMWGYLGPLGLVIGGYIVINKDRNLGIIWFVVECLFIAQYLTLVSATPQYWWHIFILMLGGMFTITYPLWGDRR